MSLDCLYNLKVWTIRKKAYEKISLTRREGELGISKKFMKTTYIGKQTSNLFLPKISTISCKALFRIGLRVSLINSLIEAFQHNLRERIHVFCENSILRKKETKRHFCFTRIPQNEVNSIVFLGTASNIFCECKFPETRFSQPLHWTFTVER